MTTVQRNMLYSWLLCGLAIMAYQLNEFAPYVIGPFILFFRDSHAEKNSWQAFKDKHPFIFRLANISTLVIALVVLAKVSIELLSTEAPSFDNMPNIWTIAIILSPLLFLGVVHEWYLFKKGDYE